MAEERTDLPDFDAMWNYADPAATAEAFTDLLDGPAADAPAEYRAELMTQIARARGLAGEFEAAREALAASESLLEEAGDRATVRWLLEMGRVENTSGNPEHARTHFTQAWELAREAGEEALAVDAAHMMAIVAPGEATEWTGRALEVAEAADDPAARNWLGGLYNNLGWACHDAGDFREALKWFRKAHAWRQARGQVRETRLARWAVARALRSLGQHDEALQIQERLRAEWEREGEKDGYVYEELGELLLALGRDDDAKPYFAAAHDLLSDDPAVTPERLARMKRLGGDEV
jgi:tetratricopeptide (TPR) repeat protein